jgi:preprotein translocase subunit SecA
MRPIDVRRSFPVATSIARPSTSATPASRTAFGPLRTLALASGVESGFVSRVPLAFFSTLRSIEALRPKMARLSDQGIQDAVEALRARRARGASLRSLVPETFALVREASRRTLQKEHREVQLLAGLALVDRAVAQLRTGEGKTLVAALAASLFALDGKGCHVATTNGYLAERDAGDLLPLYRALGLSVGVSKAIGQTPDEKRAAYAADITYAHADTFGFDWLDDQVVYRTEWRMQRGLHYAVVDEADDVLLDTADQPMVLAGAPESDEALEARRKIVGLAEEIADRLDPRRDLRLSYHRERWRPVLSDRGVASLEEAIAGRLSIPPRTVWSDAQAPLIHQVLKALEARHSVKEGEQYIGDTERVVLVSSTTGHAQPGSRLRHGLMDAVLSKEGRNIERELLPVGQITYQSFFNMYGRLSGMTGTARGGREELRDIYGLKVIEVPPHRPSQRIDLPDLFFPHPAPRLLSAIADVLDRHSRGQPVLVSTNSVTESKAVSARLIDPSILLADVAVSSSRLFETARALLGGSATGEGDRHAFVRRRLTENPRGARAFAEFLEQKGLPAMRIFAAKKGTVHRLLNAETEAEEASIIARAGERSAITVATQMAGRGTDITLAEGVEDLGGLHVVCIGHKTNRRKDEQAIGRAGRHGERGSSQFFVSPTDAVFSFLAARRMRALCAELGADEIRQPTGMLRRAFEKAIALAQERAEHDLAYQRVIGTRYDSVTQLQRRRLIAEREGVLHAVDLPERVHGWMIEALERADSPEAVRAFFQKLDPRIRVPDEAIADRQKLRALLDASIAHQIEDTKRARGEDDAAFRQYVRDMFLYTIDRAWAGYLDDQDEVRRQAVLETYRDANPYVEFVFGSVERFAQLREEVQGEIVSRYMFHLSPNSRKASAGA